VLAKQLCRLVLRGFTYTPSEYSLNNNDIAFIQTYSMTSNAKYKRAKRNGTFAADKAWREHQIAKGKAYIAFKNACRESAKRLSIYHATGTKADRKAFESARELQIACHNRYRSFCELHE
jgi:hypothetical protein